MDRFEAIRFIGRILAPHLDGEAFSGLRTEFARGGIDWQLVVELSSHYFVTPALHSGLCEKGFLDGVDEQTRQYFRITAELNRDRNRRIHAQLLELAGALNDAGIEPLLLKGTACLVLGLYRDLGDRVIGDIDILVPRDRVLDACYALTATGYARAVAEGAYKHHHHIAPLWHAAHPAAVEIHKEVLPIPYQKVLPAAEVIAEARRLPAGGKRMAVSCFEHLVAHNIMHSQCAHRDFWSAEIPLRYAYDLALLMTSFGGQIAWGRIVNRLSAHGRLGCAAFYIRRAQEIFSTPHVPPLPRSFEAWLAEWRWRQHVRGRFLGMQRAIRFVADELLDLAEYIARRRETSGSFCPRD